MNATARTPSKSVDAYIRPFPADVRATLETVRRTIRAAAPDAEESISYQIPAYKVNGRLLVYFAGFKGHYSLFAATSGVYNVYKKRLSRYERSGKGTIRFPLDKPVPVALIRDIVRFRVRENLTRDGARKGSGASGSRRKRRIRRRTRAGTRKTNSPAQLR